MTGLAFVQTHSSWVTIDRSRNGFFSHQYVALSDRVRTDASQVATKPLITTHEPASDLCGSPASSGYLPRMVWQGGLAPGLCPVVQIPPLALWAALLQSGVGRRKFADTVDGVWRLCGKQPVRQQRTASDPAPALIRKAPSPVETLPAGLRIVFQSLQRLQPFRRLAPRVGLRYAVRFYAEGPDNTGWLSRS